MKVSLLRILPVCVLVSNALAASVLADAIYIESIPASAVDSPFEGVSYTASGVGFAAIRFEVPAAVPITGAVATLHNSGTENLFFAGIESLPSPTAVPSYTLAAGPGSLLAYSEAVAGTAPYSELLFPLDVVLSPGSYALVVGCAVFDCYGALATTSDPAQLLIPDEDFLVSFGTTSSQNWGYNALNFRLGLLTIPEPGSALLLGSGLGGLTLLARRRRPNRHREEAGSHR